MPDEIKPIVILIAGLVVTTSRSGALGLVAACAVWLTTSVPRRLAIAGSVRACPARWCTWTRSGRKPSRRRAKSASRRRSRRAFRERGSR